MNENGIGQDDLQWEVENVYDILEKFYASTEEWEEILQKSYVEGFLRQEAWNGASDDKLRRIYDQVIMLCLYAGYGDVEIGDFDRTTFVNLLAWCARNVAEFTLTAESVDFFLAVTSRLYQYLYSKRAISRSDEEVVGARQLLLASGELKVLTAQGQFLKGAEKWEMALATDLEQKLFLDFTRSMEETMGELYAYFFRPDFFADIKKAIYYCCDFCGIKSDKEIKNAEDFWPCFWDYFFFDYHLTESGQTPLAYYCATGRTKHPDFVAELCKVKLVIYSVVGQEDSDIYLCRNFLTGDEFSLELPCGEQLLAQPILAMGHVFYADSISLNYLHCIEINKFGQQRLRELINECYSLHQKISKSPSFTSWLEQYPEVVRKIFYGVRRGQFELVSLTPAEDIAKAEDTGEKEEQS